MLYFKCKPFAHQHTKAKGSTNAAQWSNTGEHQWLDCISKTLNSHLKRDSKQSKLVLRKCTAWSILGITCLLKQVAKGLHTTQFWRKQKIQGSLPSIVLHSVYYLIQSTVIVSKIVWKSFKSLLVPSVGAGPLESSLQTVLQKPPAAGVFSSCPLVSSHIAGSVAIFSLFLFRPPTHGAVGERQQHLTGSAALTQVMWGLLPPFQLVRAIGTYCFVAG